MTLYNLAITLGTAAQVVVPGGTSPVKVYLHNMEHASNRFIHLGGSGITTANSLHLDPSATVNLVLNRTEALYALSDPNGCVLGVLYQTMDE